MISKNMDLMGLVLGFMAEKQEQLSLELAEKYSVTQDEVAGVVASFLRDTYEPAISLVRAICDRRAVLLLYISRKDCPICQRSEPIIDGFLSRHKEIELVRLDYSEPSGLLYHIINRQNNGKLPLIAFIFSGSVKIAFAGECLPSEVYEKYYNDLIDQCCQNIYAN